MSDDVSDTNLSTEAESVGGAADLSCSGLADHSLTDGSCLESIVKAKASDVRLSADPFYSGQIFDISGDSDLRHWYRP